MMRSKSQGSLLFCFGFDIDDRDFIVKLHLKKEIIYSGQSC